MADETEIEKDTPEVTIESLTAELARERAEKTKLKSASDKQSSEIAELKKAIRGMQTAEQQKQAEDEEKLAEHNKYVSELESYKKRNETVNLIMTRKHMTSEYAGKMAEAQLANDYATLTELEKEFAEYVEKTTKADFIKGMPPVNAGDGSNKNKTDPFLAGFGD